MNKLTYILLISIVLLSSCKIGQKYEQPEMNIPQAFDRNRCIFRYDCSYNIRNNTCAILLCDSI